MPLAIICRGEHAEERVYLYGSLYLRFLSRTVSIKDNVEWTTSFCKEYASDC